MYNVIENIKKFKPSCEQEIKDRNIIIHQIVKKKEKILYRNCELYHITSSGFVINQARNKFLIVHHNIYNTWSWMGGHADGEKDLQSVALREVKEESGIVHIWPDSENIISIDILTTSSHIRKGEYVSAHLHFNISYLFVVDEKDSLFVKEDENSAVIWVNVSDIDQYITDSEMKHVFKKVKGYL
ncbi:MAG: NUDIX hydrolase [Velocimicrobium sp.]